MGQSISVILYLCNCIVDVDFQSKLIHFFVKQPGYAFAVLLLYWTIKLFILP